MGLDQWTMKGKIQMGCVIWFDGTVMFISTTCSKSTFGKTEKTKLNELASFCQDQLTKEYLHQK